MRLRHVSLAACATVASLLAQLTLLSSGQIAADEAKPAQPGPCICPTPQQAPSSAARPRYADLSREALDEGDEIAALDAIRVALSEVSDGATYVWHRGNGRLSGMIRPTTSFKDTTGRVCRHIVLILSTGSRTGQMEGIACRLDGGRWQLDG